MRDSQAKKRHMGLLLSVTASECLYLAAQLIHYEAENHQKHSEVTPDWKKRL